VIEEQGFNAATDTYENLSLLGVIDPTKVVRTALRTPLRWPASSSPPKRPLPMPEDKAPAMGGGMPGGMGGMGGMDF
jgi:chaperonin GroEL